VVRDQDGRSCDRARHSGAAARDVQALNTFGDLDTFKTEGIVGSSRTIAKS
jgi:hypothetical protein